jgi:hypothetical protein
MVRLLDLLASVGEGRPMFDEVDHPAVVGRLDQR